MSEMQPAASTAAKTPHRVQRRQEVMHYPDSDGKPTAENDPQYRCITDTRFALEQYYRDDAEVYVGADLLVHYEEGNPNKSVAPDVLALSLERGIQGIGSEVLELELWMRPDGGEGMPYVLRLYNPAANAWLLTPEEKAEARRQAEARTAKLEEELAHLRAQLNQDNS